MFSVPIQYKCLYILWHQIYPNENNSKPRNENYLKQKLINKYSAKWMRDIRKVKPVCLYLNIVGSE